MTMALAPKKAHLPHVLVLDDDDRIRDLTARYLQDHGFVACTAQDAAQARAFLAHFSFDVMVADVMMPGETGLSLVKSLREAGETVPVLMLTALGEAEDRIAGLETGADDYLPKPFEPRELLLRIHSLLRRSGAAPGNMPQGRIAIGPWTYDPAVRELLGAQGSVRLTESEASLLDALAGRSGMAVSRLELARLCGLDEEGGERTIDVQVTRLRRKIEADTRNPRYIQTVRGKGYMLRAGA